ncbi:Ankyrin-1 [Dactylella cylindrospora]|nr:Ankyrin-1 [Dactylella cylindrospora]
MLTSTVKNWPESGDGYTFAYKSAMNRIESQFRHHKDKAESILSWTAYSKQLTTGLELSRAVAIEVGKIAMSGFALDEPLRSSIILVRAGLVTTDEMSNLDHLVHRTAYEYFEEPWDRCFPGSGTLVARPYAAYPFYDSLKSSQCRNAKDSEARLNPYLIYKYSANNWGYHVLVGGGGGRFILNPPERDRAPSSRLQALVCKEREYLVSIMFAHYCATLKYPATYFRLGEDGEDLFSTLADQSLIRIPQSLPLWASRSGRIRTVDTLLQQSEREYLMSETGDIRQLPRIPRPTGNAYEKFKQLLLGKGSDVEREAMYGRTLLSLAAEEGHADIVSALLSAGASPRSRGSGYSPMHHQMMLPGSREMVKLLLRGGADFGVDDSMFKPTLSLAPSCNYGGIIRILIDNCSEVRKIPTEQLLLWQGQKGSRETVELLLRTDINTNALLKGTPTALLWSVKMGYEAMAKFLLLSKGASIKVKGDDGPSDREALGMAAGWGKLELVGILLDTDQGKGDGNNEGKENDREEGESED